MEVPNVLNVSTLISPNSSVADTNLNAQSKAAYQKSPFKKRERDNEDQ
jgi:hypothetical protein